MTNKEAVAIVERSIRQAEEQPHVVDRRPFLARLLCSMRVKVSGFPKPKKIELTGNADF